MRFMWIEVTRLMVVSAEVILILKMMTMVLKNPVLWSSSSSWFASLLWWCWERGKGRRPVAVRWCCYCCGCRGNRWWSAKWRRRGRWIDVEDNAVLLLPVMALGLIMLALIRLLLFQSRGHQFHHLSTTQHLLHANQSNVWLSFACFLSCCLPVFLFAYVSVLRVFQFLSKY